MIKIETIAATKEINNMTAQQLNDEQTLMSGKFAGTCYAKEGYATIRTQPEEKAMKRALGTAKNGHHFVFRHDQYGEHLPEDECDAFEFNWYFQYIRKECPLYNDAS